MMMQMRLEFRMTLVLNKKMILKADYFHKFHKTLITFVLFIDICD